MQTAYEYYNNKIGVKLSFLLSDIDKCTDNSLAVMTYSAYQSKSRRFEGFRLRSGGGKGNEVLISWDGITEYQPACIERFGNPKTEINALDKYFKLDPAAKRFFEGYRFEEGTGDHLSALQIRRYTINASVMNAVVELKCARQMLKKSQNGKLRTLWFSLSNDVYLFNEILKTKYNFQHTLGTSERTIRTRYADYIKYQYLSIIDGRNNNSNAQIVTPEMIKLWRNIYAGQRNYKPGYNEVSIKYDQFLAGTAEIMTNDTAECQDHTLPCYRPASEHTVYSYQEAWESRSSTHAIRSNDRQKFKGMYDPFHKLKQPEFAGSIVSIDDRQPPFEYASGKRMWFYCAADLGSGAFTNWVYGDTKEGIIEEFYRQMVRNYTEWGFNLPWELECESSLNASYKDNLLAPGAMFQEVRIEANNARGKKIEQYWRQMRLDKDYDKKEEGWLARPFALSETNQKDNSKVPLLSKSKIVDISLKNIERWNNSLHNDQVLHPGMTRWEVFEQKQHPDLLPTNWAGILPHIGFVQKTSMKAGRIVLQGKHRVVGFDGEVALGDRLIAVMKKIEGETVNVYWLDDNDGNVIKALVYNMEGRQICELLGDLEYHRAKLEQKEEDFKNRELTSAYAATVQGFIRRNANEIDRITIITEEPVRSTRFQIAKSRKYTPTDTPATMLPPVENDVESVLNGFANEFKSSTADRF